MGSKGITRLVLLLTAAILAFGLSACGDPPPTETTTSVSLAEGELFADPDQPFYEEGKGFAPDADRILLATALAISVELYSASQGHYPTSLADLFPEFAPTGKDGNRMTSAPAECKYQSDGTSYQLAITLESGRDYEVRGP